MSATKIQNAKVSVGCPRPREGWQSFQFNLKHFKDLSTTREHYVETPDFSCNGHEWFLEIYPGGNKGAAEGHVSIFLYHHSEGSISTNYQLMIIDKFGKKKRALQSPPRNFEGMGDGHGCKNFMKRSVILDESQNILDSNGTLAVVVSIEEEPTTVFVPKNPFQEIMLGIFLCEDTADVCFEVVSSAEAKEGKQKTSKTSDLFHAHHFILSKCAPMLADLFNLEDNDGKIVTATITDVKPDAFRDLLWHVYGGTVEEKPKANAKDVIEAADKYSIVNLKLEAEAAYVKSTKITVDNAIDNLLYADSKNCALLKEAVMKFLAENGSEAADKISFNDVPGHLMKDLLVVIGRNSKKEASGAATDELSTLCVSALRRKLDEKGLDIDGSREAMIESIRNSS
ncbi:hypothetical protein ACHAWC_010455 [Mediolabrus comicus]